METAEHLRVVKAKVRPDLHAELRALAQRENTTPERLIVEALTKMLARRRPPPREREIAGALADADLQRGIELIWELIGRKLLSVTIYATTPPKGELRGAKVAPRGVDRFDNVLNINCVDEGS